MANYDVDLLHQRILRILMAVDGCCREHGLRYYIWAGTMIGAVRHKGFIPWDDDIDIAMRQEDIPRFVEAAEKELPKGLFLQTPQNQPGSKEPIIKVRDLNSFFVEPSDNFSADYEKGLYVDIFPMIPYPSVSKGFVKRLTKGISKSNSILHRAHYYSLRSFAEFFWFGGKYLLFRSLWAIAAALCPKDTYISNILINNGYGIMHRQDTIFPLSTISFEGKIFSAPHNPDVYLKDLYRNYMEVPPPEKRIIHSVFILPQLTDNNAEPTE